MITFVKYGGSGAFKCHTETRGSDSLKGSAAQRDQREQLQKDRHLLTLLTRRLSLNSRDEG